MIILEWMGRVLRVTPQPKISKYTYTLYPYPLYFIPCNILFVHLSSLFLHLLAFHYNAIWANAFHLKTVQTHQHIGSYLSERAWTPHIVEEKRWIPYTQTTEIGSSAASHKILKPVRTKIESSGLQASGCRINSKQQRRVWIANSAQDQILVHFVTL